MTLKESCYRFADAFLSYLDKPSERYQNVFEICCQQRNGIDEETARARGKGLYVRKTQRGVVEKTALVCGTADRSASSSLRTTEITLCQKANMLSFAEWD